MAQTSVAQFASELKVPPSVLLEQLRAAGVDKKQPDDALSEQDKSRLLEYLRKAHGSAEAKNKITLTRRQTSEIKKTDATGKYRTVQVEVRKKRVFVKRDPAEVTAAAVAAEAPPPPPPPAPTVDPKEVELRQEEARRQQQLAELQAAEIKERQDRERREAEQKAAEQQKAAEAAAAAAAAPSPAAPATTLHAPKPATGDAKTDKKPKKAKPTTVLRDDSARRRTIKTRGDAGGGVGGWHARGGGRHRPSGGGDQTTFAAPTEPLVREVAVPETITVGELAHRMSVKAAEVIKALMKRGTMATINQVLDQETAIILVEEMGHKAKAAKLDDPESYLVESDEPVEAELKPRPPVVTVMGHVDHGKTSLLDFIRTTKVAAGEAGGITQHIGAYHVETPRGVVTFLDTPGHEAFTAMRARGAQATDIVILVVAADDGVMPQTIEAINHARAANVPIIVAVNKIDKPESEPDRVKRELANQGLVPEDWGGQTIFVPTSAKKGTGIDQLLEMTALQSEVLELKANPTRAARGVIIEGRLDRGRGPVATVLIQNGTLHEGDAVVVGAHSGRIRALIDPLGKKVPTAGPSDPVELLGLSGVPSAGDVLVAVSDERKARQIAGMRSERDKSKVKATTRITLEGLNQQIKSGEIKELRLILKADVQGSVEAVAEALERLSTDEVKLKVIHSSVGAINEGDVMLASASNAIVLGFNVKAEPKAAGAAQANGVDVRNYNVIYEAINDVK